MKILFLLIEFDLIYLYTPIMNDFDLYGTKVAMNDDIMVSVDNLNMLWYVSPVIENNSYTCFITFNKTSCYFVYRTIVPISNLSIIVYNCINQQGNNVIGFFQSNGICPFYLMNEQIISNYSTQDNFMMKLSSLKLMVQILVFMDLLMILYFIIN
jgi:hypothetical protein